MQLRRTRARARAKGRPASRPPQVDSYANFSSSFGFFIIIPIYRNPLQHISIRPMYVFHYVCTMIVRMQSDFLVALNGFNLGHSGYL